jgi:hypothetical protein
VTSWSRDGSPRSRLRVLSDRVLYSMEPASVTSNSEIDNSDSDSVKCLIVSQHPNHHLCFQSISFPSDFQLKYSP